MKQNVASQSIGAEMITASDGSAFTGSVSVLYTIDNGTQTSGGGTAPAHEGNGYHSYTPLQAETNGAHIAFTFTGSGAITTTVQVYTLFPQTVDNDTKISLIPTTAMRGTDSAATSAKQDTMETTLNDVPTTAEFNARTILAASYFDPSADTVANVTTVGTTTTNTDMRGTDSAATASALATAQTDLDTITGADGATLATSQALYAPAKAGDSMDVLSISGDTIAADNLELQYDTTGLAGDTFPATQSQVGNIAVGSAAIGYNATGFTLTTGSETLTYAATTERDGVVHEVAPSAGNTDGYYTLTLPGNGVATAIKWAGYVQSNGDEVEMQFYDWIAAAYVTENTVSGSNGTTIIDETIPAVSAYTGTGVNLGQVRFRFLSTTSTNIATDRLIFEATVVAQSVGYADGAIWVDTNASNTNTENFIDGTADNPVSTWAAALTLSGQLNITRFHIINGSSITLTGNSDNYNIMGQGFTLSLNSQSVASAYIFGATTDGIGTGGGTVFEDCPIGNVSLEPSIMRHCFYFGTVTNTGTGDWFINDPRSRVAGSGTPIFDFGTAIGNTNLNIRANSGGWKFESMGDTGTDVASIEGWGQIIEGTCTSGTVTVRGNFTESGFTNLTLSDDARFDSVQLVDDVWDEVISKSTHDIGQSAAKRLRQGSDLVQIDGTVSDASPATTNFDTNLTQIDTYFDDSVLIFSNGSANAGIGRPVSDYLNANGNMSFDTPDDWPVTPVNGDDFVIYATHVHPVAQIQSGLATEAKQDIIDANVDSILVDTGTTLPAQISALNNITAASVLAAGDADGFSLEEALKLLLAASTGVLAGAATSSITIEAADGSKTRITATVDVDGNRSVVVRDATG